MTHKILIICVVWFSTFSLVWANPERKTIQVGGFEREYLVYTPKNQQEKAGGIIVCLHGFTRTMNDFFESYNVSNVADSLNLIIVAPQALPEQNDLVKSEAALINLFSNDQISLNSVWGCGLSVKVYLMPLGITLLNEELNRDVDDVDFINKLIDNILLEYSLPSENVFILGTSMGGYMAYQFALKNGERLSGLISVAGSMGLAIKGMDYSTKIPVCDFHSVTDEVVPYSGSIEQSPAVVSLAMNKSDVIKYWTETNLTGAPVVKQVQNYPSTNEITVEKITYPDPVNEVIHYKMNGASHSYFLRKENGDCMDYLEEIAGFIGSHLSGSFNQIPDVAANKAFFYPNPVRDNIYFETMTGIVSIFDITGKKIFSQSFSSGQTDLSFLKPGIYIIRVQSGNTFQVNRLIKQ